MAILERLAKIFSLSSDRKSDQPQPVEKKELKRGRKETGIYEDGGVTATAAAVSISDGGYSCGGDSVCAPEMR